jgi:hypothetical protein
VRSIFLYLERTYLISSLNMDSTDIDSNVTPVVRNLSPAGFPSFWLIGLNFMKENIKRIDLKDKLINGILDLISHDRQNSNS